MLGRTHLPVSGKSGSYELGGVFSAMPLTSDRADPDLPGVLAAFAVKVPMFSGTHLAARCATLKPNRRLRGCSGGHHGENGWVLWLLRFCCPLPRMPAANWILIMFAVIDRRLYMASCFSRRRDMKAHRPILRLRTGFVPLACSWGHRAHTGQTSGIDSAWMGRWCRCFRMALYRAMFLCAWE